MVNEKPYRVKTISEFHRLRGLPKPEHPSVSVVNFETVTDLSVTEIAYELGFEHPQSFSKLFKTKTSLSPSKFRRSFN